MQKYVAAMLSIAFAVQPAVAAEIGIGGKAGGVGVSAHAGAGGVGVGVGAGGVGASIGAGGVESSVGAGRAGVGASVEVDGAGVSAGATGGAAATSSSTDAAAASSSPEMTLSPSTLDRNAAERQVILPPVLLPSGEDDRQRELVVFTVKPGTPESVVFACQDAVALAASSFGSVRVSAWSAGAPTRLSAAEISAPVLVRIEYFGPGGVEIREASVECQVSASGEVLKLT